MSPIRFPDPRRSTPEGLVAVGGDLRTEVLVAAYRQGIFPWPTKGYPLVWFCPPRRAILEFDRLHIPRSLARARARTTWRFSFDAAFDEVIERCAVVPRAGESGTWITGEMIRAYKLLHRQGFAHSVEVWDGARLVGGLYGVAVGGAFAGESMFHLEANASKLGLLHLIDSLRARGAEWIDIQMLTPHMEALGAREITRDDFLARLDATHRRGLRLFDASRSNSTNHEERT